MNKAAHYPVASWLFLCCGLVFVMVLVGAITRLTDSGLSMVEWRLIMGILPPLSDTEWQRVYGLYQEFPEFEKKHFWMELEDFKRIFFWEWFHRLLGRLIGLVYALPLLWFWIRGHIPAGYKPALLGLLFLGACQGLMGWYMVQSGLVDRPAVSHYRLAAHLVLAFIIYAALLWTALSCLKEKSLSPGARHPLFKHGMVCAFILGVTIIWGAFTAGLDAGLVYNEHFPMMDADHWLPADIHQHDPLWSGFIAAHGGVQFVHRWLAVMTVFVFFTLWLRGFTKQQAGWPLHGLMLAVTGQFILGLLTLLSKVALPLATAHQGGALVVISFLILFLHRARRV